MCVPVIIANNNIIIMKLNIYFYCIFITNAILCYIMCVLVYVYCLLSDLQ